MKRIIAWLLLGAMALVPAGQAMAALTVSNDVATVFGNKHIRVADITWDSSYATGGEELTPANLGLTSIDVVVPLTDNAAWVFSYDYSAETLMAFGAPAADYTVAGTDSLALFDEADSETDLSGVLTKVLVIGN